uniref:Uncharacterized protein n=1 Tax=viral metagenome TaxID=1070528 RepID=A0A6C0EIU5_9ZZZZ
MTKFLDEIKDFTINDNIYKAKAYIDMNLKLEKKKKYL